MVQQHLCFFTPATSYTSQNTAFFGRYNTSLPAEGKSSPVFMTFSVKRETDIIPDRYPKKFSVNFKSVLIPYFPSRTGTLLQKCFYVFSEFALIACSDLSQGLGYLAV